MFQRAIAVLSYFALVTALAGCSKPPRDVPSRGHDPWVMRLTLDGRPRMLVLALRSDFWVAYDAERGALYDVSSQAISFDGAVYNTHHGPQPSTQGPIRLSTLHSEPWHMQQGALDERPKVQYAGLRFEAGHAVISYVLVMNDGTRAEVEERPEILPDRNGVVSFERRFQLRAAPGITVTLDFNAPAVEPTAEVEWNADGNGRLRIRPDRESRLVFTFATQSDASPVASSPQAALPPGERLIATNDCATCHNPVNQTVGPSYKQVAERYRTNPQTIAGLAAKIRQGGGDQWGDSAMVAHPGLSLEDATTLAEYILNTFDPGDALGSEVVHPNSNDVRGMLGFDPALLRPGLSVELFELGHNLESIPELDKDTLPNVRYLVPELVLDQPRDFPRPDPSSGFLLRASGWLLIDRAGDYALRLEHDGPLQLKLDDAVLLSEPLEADRSPWVSTELTAGLHPFEVLYASRDARPQLALLWEPPGGEAGIVPRSALRAAPLDAAKVKPGLKGYHLRKGAAGDGRPLTRLHPSFRVHSARPHDFLPRVGGLDFLPGGQPVISTWDARGAVYVLDDVHNADPENIRVTRFADGLAEPLGVKVVDGRIYVLQKHELTELIDHDHDGVADDYRTVSNAWGSTGNFHEFAFGLAYADDYFYATLAIGIEPGGSAMVAQNDDRGRVVRISRTTGALEHIARGLRTPNGIGFGTDGELFVTDNEGDWLPANKLIHVRPGAFYGSYSVNPTLTKTLPVSPPVLWLPVDEFANSPSQPLALNLGPYRNQILYGDVTYGGLNRAVLRKVNGNYQGCAMPFIQGLEAGVNRAAFGPDGSLYVGGIGNPGNWAQEGKLWYGLQRIEYTGEPAFEMLEVALAAGGVEIALSEPLHQGDAERPSDYELKQWSYVPTADYGGPKVGEQALEVQRVHISADRRRIFLQVDGIETGRVLYVHLKQPPMSSNGRELWTADAYCTVNELPSEPSDLALGQARETAPNTLSAEEQAAGVRLLFDGKSLKGLRSAAGGSPQGWAGRDGWLTAVGKAGSDLVTQDGYFTDFELDVEWRAESAANGGIFYRVANAGEQLWKSGVEFQVVDDSGHPDGREPLHRSGSAYDLFAPQLDVLNPVTQVNRARIVARGSHIEHWLNGHQVLSYDTQSPAWQRQLQGSKFASIAGFGSAPKGAVGLQHHGAGIAYRNLKLRVLDHPIELRSPINHPRDQPARSAD